MSRPDAPPARVLVCDDHPVVRAGLKLIIDAADDMHVAGEAATATEALERLRAEQFDVLLLDLALPDRSGIEVIRQLRASGSELPILVLSYYPEDQYALETVEVGAQGYLQKEGAPEEVLGALRCVLNDKIYISPALAALMVRRLQEGPREDPLARLSEREVTVLCAIANGESLAAIGHRLGISVNTVSTYRGRVLQKLDLANNAELIRFALERGLLD